MTWTKFWTPERKAVAAQCKERGMTLTHEVGTEIWRVWKGAPDVDFYSPLLFWSYKLSEVKKFLQPA